MDTPVYPAPPFFNAAALSADIAALPKTDRLARRAAIVALLKPVVIAARVATRAALEATGDGLRCAAGLASFQDALIGVLAGAGEAPPSLAIVASGGYGRGLLAPFSDIDLLFLTAKKAEPAAEFILYALWDLGFKVGHATRSVDQSLKAARGDMTIRTALLDARRIIGDPAAFETLTRRLRDEVFDGTARAFIAAKLAERDERHARTGGASRYRVEPNIKDGKGGLRDLHTLYWIAKYLNPGLDASQFVARGVFSPAENKSFHRANAFLWRVRCALHFLTGKAEERLTFDLQSAMAESMGYRPRVGLPAVERFMKHYFLIAKDVGDLTRVVCADLELRQLKSLPVLDRLAEGLGWRGRVRLATRSDFRIENGRLQTKTPDVFRHDPVNLIRIFAVAERHKTPFHPAAFRLIRASLRLIDDTLRADPEANRLFLDILTSPSNPERILRRMNEAGVLGRFIPAFGRVVSMMQFNMYHHYTVDEHLIRAVGILSEIERGGLAPELPLSTEVIRNIEGRRALYVALFLHDVAKAGQEDHSIAGARLARELGPRLGLTPAETETAAWLIAEHLTMSQTAQSRDISDPKTLRDFAARVQSRERLKLLMLLTVADIRAVGPGVWTAWKGQLLRQLYAETEPIISGGHTAAPREARIREAQVRFGALLPDWPLEEISAAVARHRRAYWLRFDAERHAAHARLMRGARETTGVASSAIESDTFTGITDMTIYSPDRPRLVATIAGACAAAGANIVGATLTTTRDGMALNIMQLSRAFDDLREEEERVRRIITAVDGILTGVRVPSRSKPQSNAARIAAFEVAPQIVIDNTASEALTVIEVSGRDRPGLLRDLTTAIADARLDISSAHIATFGEKAVDTFYVNAAAQKITGEGTIRRLREQLAGALSS